MYIVTTLNNDIQLLGLLPDTTSYQVVILFVRDNHTKH